jgi:hypothetical protein
MRSSHGGRRPLLVGEPRLENLFGPCEPVVPLAVAVVTSPAPQPLQQPSMWEKHCRRVMGGLIVGMLFRSLGFAATARQGAGSS